MIDKYEDPFVKISDMIGGDEYNDGDDNDH